MQFPWIKRPDLFATPHDAGGWVVKDPVGLNYALLDDAEYAFLNLLDGKTPFARLLSALQSRFPERRLSAEDLAELVRLLAGHELIRQTQAGDSQRLNRTKSRSSLRWLRPIFGVLRLQFPLWNPSRLLNATMPVVEVAFRPAVIRLLMVVMFAAVAVVVLHFSEFQAAIPNVQQFLGVQNVVLLLLIFVVVKLLHEAGHALTAQHFGASCSECGVMLLIFTPVLYTNVTDAWVLPRRERMLITAAGIIVELVIASVCALLWSVCAPGLTRAVLLNTVILCSLNTILFNGNPLLRFDGYFLLADALRIPNLASRASAVLQSTLMGLVTGCVPPTIESRRNRRVLLTYGVLAMVYRVFLTVAILKLLLHFSELWNLQIVGAGLAIVLLTGSFVLPVSQFLLALFRQQNTNQNDRTSIIRMLAAATLLVFIFLIPIPQSIVAPAVVQSTAMPTYANLAGSVSSHSKYGERLEKGQLIAEFTNPELERQQHLLTTRVIELETQLQTLRSNPATANSELVPSLQESLEAARNQKQQFESEFVKLSVLSPIDGLLFPPPSKARNTGSTLPEFWHGRPLDVTNTGSWIERGVLLGYIGELSQQKIVACVEEHNIEFIRLGQQVEFGSLAGAEETLHGNVIEIGQLPVEAIPTHLATAGLAGGRPSENGIEPLGPTYFVTVQSEDSAAYPALYSVGRVRIQTESVSLLSRFIRYLRQTF